MLNDFLHILDKHKEELQYILGIMITDFNIWCDWNNCDILKRHNRNKEKDGYNLKINEDENFVFYRDTMDNIHCYICHSYDVGLRVKLDKQYNVFQDEIDDTFNYSCKEMKNKEIIKKFSKQ